MVTQSGATILFRSSVCLGVPLRNNSTIIMKVTKIGMGRDELNLLTVIPGLKTSHHQRTESFN